MTTLSAQPLTNFDENAHHIAKRQYLQGTDGDLSGMFRRIATWVAGAEEAGAREHWAQAYYDLMAGKKFCPGGRVLAGAGTQHGNVLNCFVQGATEHAPHTFEGVAPRPGRVIMFRFPSEEHARTWYADPEYQALSEHRRASTRLEFLTLVHGMPART